MKRSVRLAVLLLPLLLPATAQTCGPFTFVVTGTGPGCSPPILPSLGAPLTVSIQPGPGPGTCRIGFAGAVLTLLSHVLVLGLSDPALDLGPYGFPGCTLRASPDSVAALSPSGSGGSLLVAVLPKDPARIGSSAYAQ